MGQLSTVFREYEDPFGYLAAEGWMWRFHPAALSTTATGATSVATTTPTFLFAMDAGVEYVAIPAEARLFQAGTVAGGAITYLMEIDNADRYDSGGTALTASNVRMGARSLPSGIAMYDTNSSAITATDAAGARIDGALLGQDVSPAEGAVNQVIWTPQAGVDILVPTASLGASWLINTSATSTGPTWIYEFKVAIVPKDWL